MMNIQPYQNYYPYVAEPQAQFHVEMEGQSILNNPINQEQNTSSNFNDLNLFQQNFYTYNNTPYQYEYVQEHEIPSQMKNKKQKKNKQLCATHIRNNDQKGLLPKTLESEKLIIEDPQQIAESIKPIPHYPVFHYTQGSPLPKLQSDIVSNPNQEGPGSQEGSQQTQKQKGQHQQTKKPKKENINTGHWSTDEHSTYINFLQQYENIMTSSMMKKTSKIFKQMSELIGTRTPSQCRSHHQKFNPYALRGENGKRLPRAERSRAGRKKKNPQSELPKADVQYEAPEPYYYMMLEQQKLFYAGLQDQNYWNAALEEQHQSIKKEEDPEHHYPQDFEEYLKQGFQFRNQNLSEYNYDPRNQTYSDLS